jgi:prepilin-type N-terminal cleavage/methylation domain-containing protein
MSSRALGSRLGGQGGYTLVELLAVLAIFLTIVTALTTLFISGSKAELDANARFQAQQSARLALDKLRRELHCSTGITKTDGTTLGTTPVAAIRVTLPSHCPTAGGATITVDYQAVTNGSGGWKLTRAKTGSPAVPIANHLTNDDIFTYTAQSAETRALLHVDMPVNVNPNEGWKEWRLVDDIVLRNTLRLDP